MEGAGEGLSGGHYAQSRFASRAAARACGGSRLGVETSKDMDETVFFRRSAAGACRCSCAHCARRQERGARSGFIGCSWWRCRRCSPRSASRRCWRRASACSARTACRRPKARWAHRRAAYPDLELRLIGPLQSNKAKEAVELFDVIETLDREKLAGALADACAKAGRSAAHLCPGEYGRGRAEGGRGAAGG
jgi:hypothetical protein